MEQRARISGLQFKEIHQLPEGEFVDFGESDRVVLPSRLGERVGGRLVFGGDQFVHRVPAQKRHVGNIFAAVRNGEFLTVISDRQERNDFVEGTFGI